MLTGMDGDGSVSSLADVLELQSRCSENGVPTMQSHVRLERSRQV